jgi:hypothetical protein
LRVLLLPLLLILASNGWNHGLTLASTSSSEQTLYDEQLFLSFTQSFTDLSYNVTAVSQCGTDGIGIGYFLNGLTNMGYWYQVGLSWRWPLLTNSSSFPTRPGFDANYEVFSSNGSSFHIGGKGPMLRFMSVSPGDTVLLRMRFSTSNVSLSLHDWNTNDSNQISYDAFGAGAFVPAGSSPANHNGFFTGLMTEQYHSSPYYGDEKRSIYSQSVFPLSSAWMSIDEFRAPYSGYAEFNQNYFANYASAGQMMNFTSNGAFESSNGNEFITGSSNSGFECPQTLWQILFERYWYIIPSAIAIAVAVAFLMIRRSQHVSYYQAAPPPLDEPSTTGTGNWTPLFLTTGLKGSSSSLHSPIVPLSSRP